MIANMVPPWGTKVHYMSGIHTNVTNVQLPSGQARYSYPRVKPQNAEMTPFMCIDDGLRFIEGTEGSGQRVK
jgi:hypothetical protein